VLAEAVAASVGNLTDVEVVLAPPFTALAAVAQAVSDSRIAVGAQDLHWPDEGAFTGAISPVMVRELASHVILGHSERRCHFGETDADVNRKVHAALAHGLVPIICVGETEAERDAGRTDAVVPRQLNAALEGVAVDEVARAVVAYEPVWAIGTGRSCDPREAERVASLIRHVLGDAFDVPSAAAARVLYGGSVNPGNIEGYVCAEAIDGALVGGASLAAARFEALVHRARGVYVRQPTMGVHWG